MGLFYNLGITLLENGIRFSGLWRKKERLWAEGRKGLIEKIRNSVGSGDRIFWIHAASVGEFEQGRPIIEAFRSEYPDYKILLTFYSASGYELRKNYKGADYVFYFPSDRIPKVKEFLDAIHPEIAVFIKYEFWLNTLDELRKRKVRTFLVSSIFRADSVFFKPWGGIWRKALNDYETIFVQNEDSRKLLARIGATNVIVAGDTRFDRVHQIVRTENSIPLVEEFIGSSKKVFVAGSTWGPDEALLIPLVNDNPDVKFIIAPHEMDEARIGRIIASVKGGARRYSSPGEDICGQQVLIIDTVGLLSTIYRYASYVYIGGGFGVGIHNTVEPASYGLPLAFGPKYRKFDEAVAMCRSGIAKSVKDYAELSEWFETLKKDEARRLSICKLAIDYTNSQLGATELIMKSLRKFSNLCLPIFERAISDYHKNDDVDSAMVLPYAEGTIEGDLYRKNWIDTVQWHLEDIIRDPEIDPVKALELKRRIDRSNQERTDLVEKIDSYFYTEFRDITPTEGAKINTESPAWAVDRLSILTLKIYHMKEQTERTDVGEDHINLCRRKLEVLIEQKRDLSSAIDDLLEDIRSGRKYMKVYRQMKMYNDESTNPVLYSKK